MRKPPYRSLGSPRRSSSSSSTSKSEAKSLAQDLLDDPSFDLDPSQYDCAVLGLKAIHHQAMLQNDKTLQRRVDQALIDLTDRKQNPSPRDDLSVASNGSRITITPDERSYFNTKIDALLSGSFEIATLDSAVVQKFVAVLRERKTKLVRESKYEEAAQIERNLTAIAEMRSSSTKTKPINPARHRKALAEFRSHLRLFKRRLRENQEDYEATQATHERDQSEAQKQLTKERKEVKEALAAELEDIEMGVGFRPSKALVELRSLQTNLARTSDFEESVITREAAERKEAEERRAFDNEQRKLHDAKRKEAHERFKARRTVLDKLWQERKQLLDESFEKRNKAIEKEIEAYEKKILEFEQQLSKVSPMILERNEEEEEDVEAAPLMEEEDLPVLSS
jgi:hypothetical protein